MIKPSIQLQIGADAAPTVAPSTVDMLAALIDLLPYAAGYLAYVENLKRTEREKARAHVNAQGSRRVKSFTATDAVRQARALIAQAEAAGVVIPIDRAAPVVVSVGPGSGHRSTWGEFLDDNADGLDTAEIAQIERDLLKRPGCTAFWSGGAHGDASIRLLVGADAQAVRS